MPADKSYWRTPAFRHNVVVKIDETIQKSSGTITLKKSVDMENYYFQRAKTKAEYVGSVSRYILRVRKTIKKNTGLDIPPRIKGISTEEVSWRSTAFRETVTVKINEAIQLSGTTSDKNGFQLEKEFYNKAETKEEYLDAVDKFIFSLREFIKKNTGIDMAPGMAMNSDTWRSTAFRKTIVDKINEILKRSRIFQKKTSFEMESKLFEKAKTEEEYLGFVARVILHIEDISLFADPVNSGSCITAATEHISDLIKTQQSLDGQNTESNQMIVQNRTCPRPQETAHQPPLKKQRMIGNERGEN